MVPGQQLSLAIAPKRTIIIIIACLNGFIRSGSEYLTVNFHSCLKEEKLQTFNIISKLFDFEHSHHIIIVKNIYAIL